MVCSNECGTTANEGRGMKDQPASPACWFQERVGEGCQLMLSGWTSEHPSGCFIISHVLLVIRVTWKRHFLDVLRLFMGSRNTLMFTIYHATTEDLTSIQHSRPNDHLLWPQLASKRNPLKRSLLEVLPTPALSTLSIRKLSVICVIGRFIGPTHVRGLLASKLEDIRNAAARSSWFCTQFCLVGITEKSLPILCGRLLTASGSRVNYTCHASCSSARKAARPAE